MTTNSPEADVARPRSRTTRDMAARVWRSRISRIASIWVVVAIIEFLAWRYFLRSSFYRDLFEPVALVVLIAGVASTWRSLARRDRDRRAGDRRRSQRRDR